ncbi:ankyrin repeat-containing protein [Ophiocordyceps camponoti-floridani]|uniref:Ankyrin repeat-containing protein n=1 Tax=Ophiocordyceps camponoti-floridani TaxID=2030778 RepID=A0A8H4VCA0_9HYPO|nr:ankyrin repeat-containing protein [Ophiocordyceps camponoti-floridani]
MRLLRTDDLSVCEFAYGYVPIYAILSHRWGRDEVTLQDVQAQDGSKKGFTKIERCCARARQDGFRYVWIDTCCIDKTSSAELSEAINSMFVWYYRAGRCYVHLADVPYRSFGDSVWFTRGWTLQELLAPPECHFLDKNWAHIGTKTLLQQAISDCTGIPLEILSGEADMETASIAQKMSWAAKRETTRVEDGAYCLLGVFGINMPLIYGEGERAFFRLQEEIMKVSDDHSLFAWEASDARGGLLATSPAAFLQCGSIVPFNPFDTPHEPWTVSSRGVYVDLRFVGCGRQGLGMAILHCKDRNRGGRPLAIYLRDTTLTMERFRRVRSESLASVDMEKLRFCQCPIRRLCIQTQRITLIGEDDRREEDEGMGNLYEAGEMSNMKLMDFGDPDVLLRAAEWGEEGLVWLLLTRSDVDVNRQGMASHTALSLAVEKENEAMVRMLLARSNIKTDARYGAGWTLLPRAAALNNINIFRQLLNSDKVDINATGERLRSALTIAVVNGNETMIQLLLQRGVDMETKDSSNQTPLMHAILNKNETVVKLLLQTGADFEAIDSSNKTPLMHAVKTRDVALTRTLLEHAAKCKTEVKYPSSLLYAVRDEQSVLASALLDHGADVDARNWTGDTPLMIAAELGDEAMVSLLLDHGANIEKKSWQGHTPLKIATRQGNEQVVRLLVERGAVTDWRFRLADKWSGFKKRTP